MEDVLGAVENAFLEHGRGAVQMPPKLYLFFPQGDLRTMPAYLEKQGVAGVKIVNVHPQNPKRGIPTVMALLVLNSIETGAPLAVMDATLITDLRTGAGGGVAVKYLARKDSKTLGLVGAGNQAKTQLLAIKNVLELEEVRVASRTTSSQQRFKEEMEPQIECRITPASIQDACNCDIVVTTTPSRKPLVRDSWIENGTHINAIGADAPGKEELDPEILRRSKIVVDDLAQASHSGEVNIPLSRGIITEKDIYAQLGEIVAGKKPGRTNPNEITVFDSTGLAVQDIATANMVHQKALEKGIGKKLSLF